MAEFARGLQSLAKRNRASWPCSYALEAPVWRPRFGKAGIGRLAVVGICKEVQSPVALATGWHLSLSPALGSFYEPGAAVAPQRGANRGNPGPLSCVCTGRRRKGLFDGARRCQQLTSTHVHARSFGLLHFSRMTLKYAPVISFFYFIRISI